MKSMKNGFILVLLVIVISMMSYMGYAVAAGKTEEKEDEIVAFKVSEVQLVNTQESSLDKIRELVIDYASTSMDIVFYESDSDQMVIKEYMAGDRAEEELAIIEQSGETLTVKAGSKKKQTIVFFGGIIGEERVEVYLPENYHGILRGKTSSGDLRYELSMELGTEIEFSSMSGDITGKGMNANKIVLSSKSGDIEGQELNGALECFTASGEISIQSSDGSFECSSQSGDIELRELNGSGKIQTTSGDISCDQISGKLREITSTSGDINVKQIEGLTKVSTTSGEIRAELISLSGDITVGSTSGDTTLLIPSDSKFSFTAETNSGDIRTSFEEDLLFNKKGNQAHGMVGEGASYKIKMKSTSGDINVRYN